MDLSFVHSLIKDFIESTKVDEKLQIIESLFELPGKKAHDYEKWLQIEFAMFLHQRNGNDIADWGREKKYELDGRKKETKKNKNSTTVDFWLKRKYQKKPGNILIEFKRARSINGCVKQMIKDGALLRKIKDSSSKPKVRSFWMVGFHPTENESHNVFDKAFSQEQKLNEWVNERKLMTEEIKGTGLSFSIFTLYKPPYNSL